MPSKPIDMINMEISASISVAPSCSFCLGTVRDGLEWVVMI